MDDFDAIVIGSGMGGLSCAAALGRTGHKVLVLEHHRIPGGLTQTFSRRGFRWDVGVHYLGEVGPDGESHAIFEWLTGGAIRFASMGSVYDIVHFPGNFEIPFARPQAALAAELKEHFPASAGEIDAFFVALEEADHAARALFTQRAMPALLAEIYDLWHRNAIQKYWGRTSAEVLVELIGDPKLRAVLLAQSANYGGTNPSATSFGVHALIMRHYFRGAYYPVGGARAFADGMLPAIQKAGGQLRTNAGVLGLLVEGDAVAGVRLEGDTTLRAPRVFSAIGARNTIRLLPASLRESEWARAIDALAPSVCHVALYLGLEGDIRSCGASAANHWYHESWDSNGGVWSDPGKESQPPGLFVSFPSLKDPAHEPGDRQRHTAEIVALAAWEPFAAWGDSRLGNRPHEYAEYKSAIERNLLAQFARHFPALAPMVVVSELSTPLTTASFIGSEHGAIYGLETSPRRFLSPALRTRTPVHGLYLAGQDVVTPGVTGAMRGGLISAASVEPRVLVHLG